MIDDDLYRIYLVSPGPRPPFGEVVDHVYGAGANVDTDGDSHDPRTTGWSWLCMQLRPPPGDPLHRYPQVEILMEEDGEDLMCVASEDEDLALRTAAFLAERSGATVTRDRPARRS